MIVRTTKEVCRPCKNFINIGQPILECEICVIGIHTKCHITANFSCINGLWVCKGCAADLKPRYNPFASFRLKDSDKFYDDEGACDDNIIQSISDVLDNCKRYTALEFSTIAKQFQSTNEIDSNINKKQIHYSSLFINIYGNGSNFDNFSVELKRYNFEFSIIGIAETNTDEALKDLYQIPQNNSFYQYLHMMEKIKVLVWLCM